MKDTTIVNKTSISQSDLVTLIQNKLSNYSPKEVKTFVDTFIETIIEEIRKGNRISMVNFVSISTYLSQACNRVNPKTLEKLAIPAKTRIHTKRSKKILD